MEEIDRVIEGLTQVRKHFDGSSGFKRCLENQSLEKGGVDMVRAATGEQ